MYDLSLKQSESPPSHAEALPYVTSYRAIDNGANAIAEGFLFGVAALLIVGETWRSSRSQAKRREGVDDRLDDLTSTLEVLSKKVDTLSQDFDEKWSEERQRYVTSGCHCIIVVSVI